MNGVSVEVDEVAFIDEGAPVTAPAPEPRDMTWEEAIESADAPVSIDLRPAPMRNRVTVVLVEGEAQIGRIIVPDIARNPTGEAVVVAVGPGAFHDAEGKHVPIPDVKIGQRVQVAKYMGLATKLRCKVRLSNGEEVMRDKTFITLHPDNILFKYE